MEVGTMIELFERIPVKGTVTMTTFDEGGGMAAQSVGNIPTDALLSLLAAAFTTLVTLEIFHFGTSNTTPLAADKTMGRQLYTKLIPPGAARVSGSHLLGEVNIAKSELNTPRTQVTGATTPSFTQFSVASAAGLGIGDFIEVNSDPLTLSAANYASITGITGNLITVGPGLAYPPSTGDYVMGIVREAGVASNFLEAFVLPTPTPTTTAFQVGDPTGFLVNDPVTVVYMTGAPQQASTIQAIDTMTNIVTLATPVSAPVIGDRLQKSTLVNHATGLLFRKDNTQTALAHVDIAVG